MYEDVHYPPNIIHLHLDRAYGKAGNGRGRGKRKRTWKGKPRLVRQNLPSCEVDGTANNVNGPMGMPLRHLLDSTALLGTRLQRTK